MVRLVQAILLCLFVGLAYVGIFAYREVSLRGMPPGYLPQEAMAGVSHIGCVAERNVFRFFGRGSTDETWPPDWYFPAGSLSGNACDDTLIQRQYAAFLKRSNEDVLPELGGTGKDVLRVILEVNGLIEVNGSTVAIIRVERAQGNVKLVAKAGYARRWEKPASMTRAISVSITEKEWNEFHSLLSVENFPVLPFLNVKYVRAPETGIITVESLVDGRHMAFRRSYELFRRQDSAVRAFLDRLLGCGFRKDGQWACWRLPPL